MTDRASQVARHLNHPKRLLTGQVAIITGSGQGIGAETAQLFAHEGAKVIVADPDAKKAAHCTAPYFRVQEGEPRCIVNVSSAPGRPEKRARRGQPRGLHQDHCVANPLFSYVTGQTIMAIRGRNM